MRAHNYYAAPGFERAGLRRREGAWIIERLADPASRFVPVWRNQNLIVEIDGGEPRAVVLGRGGVAPLIGDAVASEERLGRGELVFVGVVEERAHFALDLSAAEAPLDSLRSPALAASGIEAAPVRFADLRQLAGRLDRREAALLALARAMLYWHARHRFCGLCGSPTRSEEAGHMRRCTDPACNTMHFPRTDPAVIMLVTQGERALMGRNAAFPARHVLDARRLCRTGGEPRRGGRARGARGERDRGRARSTTTPRSRGRSRPTSCWASTPRH